MNFIQDLEDVLAKSFAQLPFHLPKNGRKWLGDNIWWIAIIFAAFSILSVLGHLGMLLRTDEVMAQIKGWFDLLGIPQPVLRLAIASLWVTLIATAAEAVLEIAAVKPLKAKNEQGWKLMFLGLLVAVLGGIIAGFLDRSFFGTLLSAAISLAMGGFFLFEIRDQFTSHKIAKKSATKKK